MFDTASQYYSDQRPMQLADLRASTESVHYDDQLSRLNKLQEELENKYKQQQMENLNFDQALIF